MYHVSRLDKGTIYTPVSMECIEDMLIRLNQKHNIEYSEVQHNTISGFELTIVPYKTGKKSEFFFFNKEDMRTFLSRFTIVEEILTVREERQPVSSFDQWRETSFSFDRKSFTPTSEGYQVQKADVKIVEDDPLNYLRQDIAILQMQMQQTKLLSDRYEKTILAQGSQIQQLEKSVKQLNKLFSLCHNESEELSLEVSTISEKMKYIDLEMSGLRASIKELKTVTGLAPDKKKTVRTTKLKSNPEGDNSILSTPNDAKGSAGGVGGEFVKGQPIEQSVGTSVRKTRKPRAR